MKLFCILFSMILIKVNQDKKNEVDSFQKYYIFTNEMGPCPFCTFCTIYIYFAFQYNLQDCKLFVKKAYAYVRLTKSRLLNKKIDHMACIQNIN